MKPKIVIILGPTASGKTDLSIKIAKKYNGEIVSADSRQMYKEFDIGTAKIKGSSKAEEGVVVYKGINHHLVDFLEPEQEYSLALFKRDAGKAIKDILKKGKLPIIVGGTGLYIQALTDNLEIPKVKPDKELRAKLEKEIGDGQTEEIIKYIKDNCPFLYSQTDTKNQRRLVRAYEICRKAGDISKVKLEPEYDCLQIGIEVSREKLYQKINERVDVMFKNGLLEEVKKLYKKYDKQIQPMTGIGYRQLVDYLQGKITLARAKELIKRDSRRYAKRQITWFKRDERIKWVDSANQASDLVKNFL